MLAIFYVFFLSSYLEFFPVVLTPRLVPEISPLDAFCDVVGVGEVGILDSRSLISHYFITSSR